MRRAATRPAQLIPPRAVHYAILYSLLTTIGKTCSHYIIFKSSGTGVLTDFHQGSQYSPFDNK